MQSVGEVVSGELVFAAREVALALPTAARRDHLVARWLLSKRSQQTRAAYLSDVRAFFAWVDEFAEQLGVQDVFRIQRSHMDAYREFLSGDINTRYTGTRHYSHATIARKLTAISSFYAYCSEEEPQLVPRNPVARVARPEVSLDSTTGSLSSTEARALLGAAREASDRTYALVGFLLTIGMRISEAVRVDTNDLDIEEGQRIVWVQRKGGKRAKLVVPAGVGEAVERYRGTRQGALFLGDGGARLRRQQVDRILRDLAVVAGYVDAEGKPRKLTPHMLRHTAATIAADAGRDVVDVQQMLGHRDLKTTQRYIRNRDLLARSAVHTVADELGAG